MPLLKGMLLSFSDPLLGLIPTIVLFQYNPTDVTRVFSGPAAAGDGDGRNAPRPAGEDYTLKLELDATDGLEKGGPVTSLLGVSPRLAAIEMLMQPVGTSLLGGLVGSLLGGGGGATVPAGKLPLVLFAWGPARITPVRLKSLTIRETSFDELLNPIHATADLGLTVLRKSEIDKSDTIARAAADYYQGAREVKAVLQLPQIIEWGWLMATPESSRYARQPVVEVVQPDGTVRRMSAPRIAPEPPRSGSYDIREGDRLDLMAQAATGDSTQWWRLADANPWPDATRLEQPGQSIDLPGR